MCPQETCLVGVPRIELGSDAPHAPILPLNHTPWLCLLFYHEIPLINFNRALADDLGLIVYNFDKGGRGIIEFANIDVKVDFIIEVFFCFGDVLSWRHALGIDTSGNKRTCFFK